MNRIAGWLRRGSMSRVLVGISLLYIAIFLLIAQTVVAQRQVRQQVMLQDESLQSINTLLDTMLDAETGQRGYLLTGNPAYLAPYRRARAQLAAVVGDVDRIAQRGGDEDQQHVGQVQALVKAKIDELARTVELKRQGLGPEAMAVVQTDAGRNDMDQLRQEIAWLRENVSQQRQAAFDRGQTLSGRLLPLVGVLGLGLVALVGVALRGERHRAWAQAEAQQLAALRIANEQTQLLARELNHRVKNLFSVVLSIITISGRKSAPTAEVLSDIKARVHALSLAHASSQGIGMEERNRLGEIIGNIMRPYGIGPDASERPHGPEQQRVRLSGPEVLLPARMITPMGLLIHELATNAAKYGALAAENGIVKIAWHVVEPSAPGGAQDPGDRKLALSWIETGGPALSPDDAADRKPGFGSRLTAMAAQQMGGTLERNWLNEGVCVKLIFALPNRDKMSKKCKGHGYHPVPVRGPMMRSQLAMPRNSHAAAVAAPHAAGFDAGEKLLGRRVLVVEDEALVAMDLLFSLEDAGAKVLGPAMSLSAALALAELAADIDCAVLDVDIAGQDVYPVARVLQRRGIPFIFHTGHGSRQAHCEMFPGAITCPKPTLPERLIELLAGL